MQIFSKDEKQIEELIGAVSLYNNDNDNDNVIVIAIKEKILMNSCKDLLDSGKVGFFVFHWGDKLNIVKNYTTTKELNEYTIHQFEI